MPELPYDPDHESDDEARRIKPAKSKEQISCLKAMVKELEDIVLQRESDRAGLIMDIVNQRQLIKQLRARLRRAYNRYARDMGFRDREEESFNALAMPRQRAVPRQMPSYHKKESKIR